MPNSASDLAENLHAALLGVLRKQKSLGDKAMAQLNEQQLFATLDPEANSIAAIVKHLHGNMRSRWSDFLTSDGEKPDRNRDAEFIVDEQERERDIVMNWWNSGWQFVFTALESLAPSEIQAVVTVRGERMTALSAIIRQVDHYGQHVGQIVLLAKHLKGTDWQTLSIPRGKSTEFEAEFRKKLGVRG